MVIRFAQKVTSALIGEHAHHRARLLILKLTKQSLVSLSLLTALTLLSQTSHAQTEEQNDPGSSGYVDPSLRNARGRRRTPETSRIETTRELVDRALTEKEPGATLRIGFSTFFFDRGTDLFAYLLSELPRHFPDFKLNTIGRKIHSTLSFMENITLHDAQSVAKFFMKLDEATLAKYDLLGDVQVFDPNHIELIDVGLRSNYIAIKPHADFVAWHLRFYEMLKVEAPEIAEHQIRKLGPHAFATDSVHLSILQYGASVDRPLTPERVTEAKQTLTSLLQRYIQDYRTNHGSDPLVVFNVKKDLLELTTPAQSLQSSPPTVISYRLSAEGKPKLSDIVTWPLSRTREKVEVYTKDLLKMWFDERFYKKREHTETVKLDRPTYPVVDTNAFLASIRPELRQVTEATLNPRVLSPTKHPAKITATDSEGNTSEVYFTNVTHPKLSPAKAISVFRKIKGLNFKSSARTQVGIAVYASSVRQEIQNPGDFDLMVNSLTFVPDFINSIEAAEAFAANAFTDDVFGQLKTLAKSGAIAINELRLGSDGTMGLAPASDLASYEENPYLSEKDVLNGQYVDRNGKTMTLAHLVSLGDFMKGKVDLFESNGTREELSLQFMTAFYWKGHVYTYQRNGLKGMPPLIRTGVYPDASSFAVAASMQPAFDFYTAQKGPILARGVRDLIRYVGKADPAKSSTEGPVMTTPFWNAKFLKKVYNFILLLSSAEAGLDQIFYMDVQRLLRAEGKSDLSISYDTLIERVLQSLNQPELKPINHLRRLVNDFKEFGELKHEFRQDQWNARLVEAKMLLKEIDPRLKTKDLDPSDEFKDAYASFRKIFPRLSSMRLDRAMTLLHSPSVVQTMADFEEALLELEETWIMGKSRTALSTQDRDFLQTFVTYSPHLYLHHLIVRKQASEKELHTITKLLGIANPEENLPLLREVSRNMFKKSRAEVGKIQAQLWFDCNAMLGGAPAAPNGLTTDNNTAQDSAKKAG